ncbi:MAG TPA: hypothetical protein VL360_04850 [Gammaproteobacteria bacterium]|jgi:hypothetical protein|nr:hypothetical protein [Gammaproteobacteria bacterium]
MRPRSFNLNRFFHEVRPIDLGHGLVPSAPLNQETAMRRLMIVHRKPAELMLPEQRPQSLAKVGLFSKSLVPKETPKPDLDQDQKKRFGKD